MKKFRILLGVFVVVSLIAAMPHQARAAEKLSNIKVTMANPIFNPGISFLWIGNFMGYFQEEGVDAEYVAAQGGAQAFGWVVSGRTHLAVPRPVPILFRTARGDDLGVVGVYLMNRDPIYEGVAVPLNSPIKTICDLKGKRIGMLSANDAGIAFVTRALQDCGLKRSDVTFLPTGVADKSALAMKLGRVDAWASVDVQTSLAEAAGFKFRMIPYGPFVNDLFGNVVWVNREFFKKNRKTVVGYLRGLAKGSIFFYTNPEAALRIHWHLYPESLPRGKSQEEASKTFLKVLLSRKDKLRVDDEKIKKFGAFAPEDWVSYVKFLGLEKKLSMDKVNTLYTNELIDEVNNFDVKAIEEQARNFDFDKALKHFKELQAKYGK